MALEYVLGVLISGALFVSFVMRIFSLTAWFESHLDHHVGLVPHTLDLVCFFWASSDSPSGVCSIVASSKGGGLFLLCLLLVPSTKMMFWDLSFLFSASTTMYMDLPSKPIRQHSRALSSSLDLVSSGTLIKHFDPKTHKWLIDGS